MYGDIKITLLGTEALAEYVVRTFALERVSLLALPMQSELPSPAPSPGAAASRGLCCPPPRQPLRTAQGTGMTGRDRPLQKQTKTMMIRMMLAAECWIQPCHLLLQPQRVL